jgi:hypothetical protein
VSPTPTDALHNVGTDTCNGLQPQLIAPGGKDPDWGAADVPGAPGGGDPGGGDPGGGTTPGGTTPGGTTPGGTTPGGTTPGGTTPGGTMPPDTTAPEAELRIPARQSLSRLRARGLATAVGCSEACDITVELLVDKRTGARLRLSSHQRAQAPEVVSAAGRNIRIGRGAGSVAAGDSETVVARLTRKARARLARVRTLKLAVRVTATDRAGNSRIVTRRITVRR